MTYEIKRFPEDFAVEEITPDKKILKIDGKYSFDEKSSGDQLICILKKTNWDTNLALRELARRLYVSRKRIGFAGTKDKRAATVQRISLWKIKPNIQDMHIKDMEIIPLCYSDSRIELGDLWGNRFTIKVYTKKKVDKKKLKKIPNFFGVQRFGDSRPLTHLVGKEILHGNLEKAVKLYLAKVFPKESPQAKEARKQLAKGWNYAGALQYFPYSLSFERTMIAHLAQYQNDYAGALRKLPKFLKIMFVHAYQSYIFNEFLKEVIKKKLGYETGPLFGTQTKPGNGLEEKILKKEKIAPADFFVCSMPEMSSQGERRKLWIEMKDFEILEKGKDYITIRFSLPKGCYATTVIDWIFG